MREKYVLRPRTTEKELVKKIAGDQNIDEDIVKKVVEALKKGVLEEAKQGKRVYFKGFGDFSFIKRQGNFDVFAYDENAEGRFDTTQRKVMPEYRVFKFETDKNLKKTIKFDETIRTITDFERENSSKRE